jgi:hypothetical protein
VYIKYISNGNPVKIPRTSSFSTYNRFLYALKAPESKRQYPKCLEVFLNFIDIEGLNLQEKLYNLYVQAKQDTE